MKKLLGLLLIGLLPLGVFAEEKTSQETFGDWLKECTETDKDKMCFISQTTSDAETKRPLVHLRVGLDQSNKKPGLVAIVPLGVIIPKGSAFVIEGSDPVGFPYLRCTRIGCQTVGLPIDDKLLDAMQKGTKAAFVVSTGGEKPVSIPVSLKGFTRAYNSIAP
jgi:invasion protein IalB